MNKPTDWAWDQVAYYEEDAAAEERFVAGINRVLREELALAAQRDSDYRADPLCDPPLGPQEPNREDHLSASAWKEDLFA
jgi:hypothetical protein